MDLSMLQCLCACCAPSGREDRVAEVICDYLDALNNPTLSYQVDPLGNVIVQAKGKETPKNKLMVLAHMDEVGMMVTHLEPDGSMRFATVGGIDAKVLNGRQVVVGDALVPGVIGVLPVHLAAKDANGKAVGVDQLVVDIGTDSKEETEKLVQLGDLISFAPEFAPFGQNMLCAKALDDRFGCFVMLQLLSAPLAYDTTFVFAVQEEVGLRGSKTATFSVQPDVAIVLETTTAADIPGSDGANRVCLVHGGPVITLMDRTTVYDPKLVRMAFQTAKEAHIPYQTKTVVAGGNDAGSVHLSRGGVKTLAVSLPTRYLHAQCCVAAIEDMQNMLDLVPHLMRQMCNL